MREMPHAAARILWHSPPVPPRVTAIIATYNWSSVLPYSIGSVLRQTFTDFELLVVGDGCTDDSARVVAAIERSAHPLDQSADNSRHQSAPNNEGLAQARGEIIAYLGHDDLWLPHHLAVIVDAFDRSHHRSGVRAGDQRRRRTDRCGRSSRGRPYGSFASPLSMAHRKRVTDEMGGWRDYRELSEPPDVELWRRAQQRGCTFTFVPRLTGVKFPASWRRGIYETRPSHEQAAWLARIDREADFEPRQLAKIIVSDHALNGLPYRDLAGGLLRQTARRIRWRFRLPKLGLSPRPGQTIDGIRRFKGL